MFLMRSSLVALTFASLCQDSFAARHRASEKRDLETQSDDLLVSFSGTETALDHLDRAKDLKKRKKKLQHHHFHSNSSKIVEDVLDEMIRHELAEKDLALKLVNLPHTPHGADASLAVLTLLDDTLLDDEEAADATEDQELADEQAGDEDEDAESDEDVEDAEEDEDGEEDPDDVLDDALELIVETEKENARDEKRAHKVHKETRHGQRHRSHGKHAATTAVPQHHEASQSPSATQVSAGFQIGEEKQSQSDDDASTIWKDLSFAAETAKDVAAKTVKFATPSW